jgi:hypothetical protein
MNIAEKLEGKRDSIGEISMDRKKVNREEWVVDILAFHLAQAIVGKDGFVGSSECQESLTLDS